MHLARGCVVQSPIILWTVSINKERHVCYGFQVPEDPRFADVDYDNNIFDAVGMDTPGAGGRGGRVESGRHRVGARIGGPRHGDAARPCAFLRRHGAAKECAQFSHALFCRARHSGTPVDHHGILTFIYRRQLVYRGPQPVHAHGDNDRFPSGHNPHCTHS